MLWTSFSLQLLILSLHRGYLCLDDIDWNPSQSLPTAGVVLLSFRLAYIRPLNSRLKAFEWHVLYTGPAGVFFFFKLVADLMFRMECMQIKETYLGMCVVRFSNFFLQVKINFEHDMINVHYETAICNMFPVVDSWDSLKHRMVMGFDFWVRAVWHYNNDKDIFFNHSFWVLDYLSLYLFGFKYRLSYLLLAYL